MTDKDPVRPMPPEALDEIEELMALPIKKPPAIILFGDEDVVGFTPASPDAPIP